jgi:hypothetical protein
MSEILADIGPPVPTEPAAFDLAPHVLSHDRLMHLQSGPGLCDSLTREGCVAGDARERKIAARNSSPVKCDARAHRRRLTLSQRTPEGGALLVIVDRCLGPGSAGDEGTGWRTRRHASDVVGRPPSRGSEVLFAA